jgi:hypothetical protein
MKEDLSSRPTLGKVNVTHYLKHTLQTKGLGGGKVVASLRLWFEFPELPNKPNQANNTTIPTIKKNKQTDNYKTGQQVNSVVLECYYSECYYRNQ